MRKLILYSTAAMLLASSMFAQEGQRLEQQMQNVGSAGANRERAPEPKISKEDRQRAMQMLEASEGGARGIEDGAGRAYALYQLARSYQNSDKKKSIALLEEAFTAGRTAIEQADSRVKRAINTQLQQILIAMIPLAPEKAGELLSQVDVQARERVVTQLLGYYSRTHQTDRALQMIYRIGQEKEIPYGAASRLMDELGKEPDQMQQLFTVALGSYRDHQADHGGFSAGGDFGDIITKFHKQLPPSLVMQAIETVLDQARKIDTAAKDKEGPAVVSIASSKGAVQLNGQYEYRLFQLLPVMRELDPQQAEKLAKEFSSVQTMLAKYPEGMGSLNTDPKNQGSGMSFMVGSGAPPRMRQNGPDAPNPVEMQRMQKIMEDAEAHPADALANASILADPRLKTQALVAVGRIAGKKNTGVANSALSKALESAQQLEGSEMMMPLREIANAYLMLDEKDEAKKAIEKGIASATKLLKEDTDADDPNIAPKPYWPSTAGWRSMLMLAIKISPAFAQEQLKEIPDQEIRTIAQIGLAQSLLEIPASDTMIMTITKDSQKMMVSRESPNE